MPEKWALSLAVLTFLILTVVYYVVYPLANSGIVGGGSDRDEALNIATTELLSGHYPYYSKTYLGNPISPLPGSLLLAIPFVLLGNSAYQNFFWLFAFLIAMKSYLKDWRLALLLLWVILALSPVVLQEIVTGGDVLSNSLYVLLFVVWMVRAIPQPDLSGIIKMFSAILLGVGLSSRANFALLLPLVFSAMAQRAGWKSAIKHTAITCITFGLVTIPFYLYAPQFFSPLHSAGKLGQFEAILPLASIVIPLATGIISLILSFSRHNHDVQTLVKNSAIVLAFPVLSGIILSSVKNASLEFSFAGFGVMFLFFAAVTYWESLYKTQNNSNIAA